MRQRVEFSGRRAVIPDIGKIFLGVTGDNLVGELAFKTPVVPDAAAYLKLRHNRNEYKLALTRDEADGAWTIAITRALLAMYPRIEAQLQLEAPGAGGDVIVWQSLIFPMYVEETIDADGAIEAIHAPLLQQLAARIEALEARVGALEEG